MVMACAGQIASHRYWHLHPQGPELVARCAIITRFTLMACIVKDKQLPDRSFKALATGVLGKLGEKGCGRNRQRHLAGELVGSVGKPAAEKAVGFVMGVLTGDAKGATKDITKDDFARPRVLDCQDAVTKSPLPLTVNSCGHCGMVLAKRQRRMPMNSLKSSTLKI